MGDHLPPGAEVERETDELERSRRRLRETDERLHWRLAFEGLIMRLSTRFINVEPEEVDRAITGALREIGSYCGVDRAYLFLLSEDWRTLSNTHEWCAEGIEPQIDNLQRIPSEACPWWMERLQRFETIHIPRVADLPPEAAAEKEILENQDIRSLIVVPTISGGSLTGFIGFDSVREEKRWADETVDFLRIVGEMFDSALERRRAASALRASEEKYRSIVESALLGIAVLQEERLVYANRSASEILGRPEEELIGLSREEFVRSVRPDDRDRVAERLSEESAPSCRAAPFLFRADLPGGGTHVVQADSYLAEYAGRPALHLSLLDVTERTETAEALQRSEERLKQLIENSEDILMLFDAGGVCLYYNGPDRYGLRPEDAVGRTPIEIYPPEEAVGILREIREVVAGGGARTIETSRTAGGETFWFSEAITPVLGEEGTVAAVAKISRNITDQKRARDALRRSEESLRAAVEGAHGFALYRLAVDRRDRRNARVLFASPSIRGILGTRDPRRFESWFENIVEEDRQRVRRANEESASTGRTFQETFRIRRAGTEEIRWVEALSRPELDDSGRPAYFNGLIIDCTARMKAEEEVKRHRDRLEELVMERTSKLSRANELLLREIRERREAEGEIRKLNASLERRVRERTTELEVANAELKELDRMKDTFLSSVSHELRTPLTSIRSFSEYLLNYDEDRETQKEFAQIINSESERLTRLINDVLDLSRIEAGGMTWNDDLLSVREVAENAVKAHLQLFHENALRTVLRFAGDLPLVRADRDRLHQVFTNLIGNAVKFSPGGSEITVGAELFHGRRSGDRKKWIRVSVTDQGPGLDEKDFEVIFEKFRQANQGNAPGAPKGTGLGLPICKEIVCHYGGNIWVESRREEGATFLFTLPVCEEGDRRAVATGEETRRAG